MFRALLPQSLLMLRVEFIFLIQALIHQQAHPHGGQLHSFTTQPKEVKEALQSGNFAFFVILQLPNP